MDTAKKQKKQKKKQRYNMSTLPSSNALWLCFATKGEEQFYSKHFTALLTAVDNERTSI